MPIVLRRVVCFVCVLTGCRAEVTEGLPIEETSVVDAPASVVALPVGPTSSVEQAPASEPVTEPVPEPVPERTPAPAPLASGCGSSPPSTGLSTGLTIVTSKGETRTYDLSIPIGYDNTSPHALVFAWHGANGTAASVRNGLKLEQASGGAAIFVYPQGIDRVNYPQSFSVVGWEKVEDADIVLFDALVEAVAADYCIDRSRVFSAGFSMGAYMTNRLACLRAGKLAAIAAHSGDGPYAHDTPVCSGKAPALFIVGDQDFILNRHLTESVEHQRIENVCDVASEAYGSVAECSQFSRCDVPVVSCVVPGLAHQIWPQAGAIIWDFFAHSP